MCGIDPWRDPGIIYHEELEKVDQEVKIDVYKGVSQIVLAGILATHLFALPFELDAICVTDHSLRCYIAGGHRFLC